MSRPSMPAGSARRGSGRRIVILGASARALAVSAARAGWDVHAADLFCDLDLEAVARDAVAVAHDAGGAATGYPECLFAAAAGFPPEAAWCYTGALENHPDLIDALARVRPLAGNAGAVVGMLRDPLQVAAIAGAAGLSFPRTLTSPDGIPLDGTWLVKPQAGAGGRGIRRWTPGAAEDHASRQGSAPHARRLWQRCVTGVPMSASYCFAPSAVTLLGVCRQLIGEPWCHAGSFAWCGAATLRTVEDLPHIDRIVASLTRLGDAIESRCRPVGLVGVDLVVDADGSVTVIEVNPRPTASMELFERSGAGSIAGHHLTACGLAASSDVPSGRPSPRSGSAWAKAVLFAARATPISQTLIDTLAQETHPWTHADGGWPALADIPRPGQTIAPGAPVATLFAAARTADDALTILRDRVARIDALLTASC